MNGINPGAEAVDGRLVMSQTSPANRHWLCRCPRVQLAADFSSLLRQADADAHVKTYYNPALVLSA